MKHEHKFSEKFFWNFFFSDNINCPIYRIKLFWGKSQKCWILKPRLFNNIYCKLNFLSTGIQYDIFGIKPFYDFS